ncbi:hypothetical protein PAMC26510_18160 [Caballeronia sordidicola]|uniref:Uncharacterized protein n=1 Tax=Caballeronia sordidicola TaxID=196367 RepID=A0A242MRW3_CABSO|nr:hypothetical protein PAMC26510_18160 [Caballeronia sordidicola]OTP79212.1 hypothetical protein PAMC26577_02295 [Caballeronia sordidicola]
MAFTFICTINTVTRSRLRVRLPLLASATFHNQRDITHMAPPQ